MVNHSSIDDIDLRPLPGKKYFSSDREWREEFIYFLLVDRFHDGVVRDSIEGSNRSLGFATPEDFYGGTLRGVTDHLDYIQGLGCTAIWLSPVLENNPGAYHGYNINNYLNIDPHFGTRQDLVDLVEAAHHRPTPMRIILDVVINHSGDNWYYPGDVDYDYTDDQRFDLGGWRRADRPIPKELQNPDLYHRRGRIVGNGWDIYPQNQHGDIVSLKDYANDDDAPGSELINILIAAYCYWIRETDIDGFRVDAVKHMGELACSRFCSMVREYAYSLGKRGFFLFGEAASPDDELYDRYIGPNTSKLNPGTVFFGIDSLLDFRLAQGAGPGREPLRDVIKGFAGPETLFNRLEAQRNRALNRGEMGRYLVTFGDNHDRFWQPGRIGWQAPTGQIIAIIGYLLCSLGTPCIYYGTEQGFEGHGGDNAMREAMFDAGPGGKNRLNTKCEIYTEIAAIAAVVRSNSVLRFGRMYFRQISGDGINFGFPYGTAYTLAFSRLLYGREVLVAYNVSTAQRNDRVIVDAAFHAAGDQMSYLYGNAGTVTVAASASGDTYVAVPLEPGQFVILE